MVILYYAYFPYALYRFGLYFTTAIFLFLHNFWEYSMKCFRLLPISVYLFYTTEMRWSMTPALSLFTRTLIFCVLQGAMLSFAEVVFCIGILNNWFLCFVNYQPFKNVWNLSFLKSRLGVTWMCSVTFKAFINIKKLAEWILRKKYVFVNNVLTKS